MPTLERKAAIRNKQSLFVTSAHQHEIVISRIAPTGILSGGEVAGGLFAAFCDRPMMIAFVEEPFKDTTPGATAKLPR